MASSAPSPTPTASPSGLGARLAEALGALGLASVGAFVRELRQSPDPGAGTDSLVGTLLRTAGVGAAGFYGLVIGWLVVLTVELATAGWSPGALKEFVARQSTTSYGFVALSCLGIVVVSGLMLKIALRTQLTAPPAADSPVVEETAYRQAEAIKREAQREKSLADRNLGDVFLLQSFEWKGVRVFDDGAYRFAPRVNVLLGKNGYGKTLILRSLAAMIQRDKERSEQLLGSSEAQWTLAVTRNGNSEEVTRDAVYFKDSVGRIPLLAIPDSRFINRSIKAFAASPTGVEPLAISGARQFLTQEPYEPVVVEFLSHLCLQYVKRPVFGPKGFELPIFRLVQSVVRQLTDDEEFKFDDIRETGRIGYEILVRTAGSRDAGLPIQAASQGTLSILAIFGLIYGFLETLKIERESDVLARPGIVLIDEIDAHLHPSWQQKVMGALTATFPNVQFIVSAHSPLIVAGCAWGEVSVLRHNAQTRGFTVDSPPGDFLGATARDLYEKIFEISDADRLYLEYATKATMTDDPARKRELERLSKKPERSATDEERLDYLQREKQLTERAAEVRQERLRYEQTQAFVAKLQSDVGRLQSKVAEQQSELARLQAALKARDEGGGGRGGIVS